MDVVFTALRVVVSLLVVVGAIWFVQKRFVRGSKSRSKSRPVSIVARQNVGKNSSVAVVEFQGRQFLLGVTEHSISVLESVVTEQPEAVAAPAEAVVEHAVPRLTAVSRRASSKEFAAVLIGMQQAPQPRAVMNTARPAPTPGAPFAGSILSGSTWKQALSVIKGPR